MFKKQKIVVIIPARGGSKGVPRKNIKLLNGRPLISYAINVALKSKYIDRVIVSTDDKEIAKIAQKYKAEVPFLRPVELAEDSSPTLGVLQHAIKYLEEKEKYKPDFVVLLQPTSPLILVSDINKAIEKIIKTKANSCVSVCEISERPEWMFTFEDTEGDRIKPFLKKNNKKTNRQDLPKIFRLNGAIYVTKKNILMKENKITDKINSSAILMPIERSVDIDRPVDFCIIESIIKQIDFDFLLKNYN